MLPFYQNAYQLAFAAAQRQQEQVQIHTHTCHAINCYPSPHTFVHQACCLCLDAPRCLACDQSVDDHVAVLPEVLHLGHGHALQVQRGVRAPLKQTAAHLLVCGVLRGDCVCREWKCQAQCVVGQLKGSGVWVSVCERKGPEVRQTLPPRVGHTHSGCLVD